MCDAARQDAELLRRFEDCTLPRSQWTHRAHVKVAFLYLRSHPFRAALDKIRTGIQKYNASQNVVEGPASGYNETTTQAFARLIAFALQSCVEERAIADAETFCDLHPELLDKQILRAHYSLEVFQQPRAKREFVAPDLAPLPILPEE